MGVNEAGNNNFSGAINLENFLAILFYPGIAQSVFGFANRNNLSADGQDSAVFDYREFSKAPSAPRTGDAGGRMKRKKLANVDQQQTPLCSLPRLHG